VTLVGTIFDLILLLTLLWLAWQMLASADLFKAVVLFISFGLLLALAWVRLDAPDVALAEVAIGAGITGALFLAALGRFGHEETGVRRRRKSLGRHLAAPVLVAAFLVMVGAVMLRFLPSLPNAGGLKSEVMAHLPMSGVTHPVTAVLLGFRAYDTLLELGVLLLAVVAIRSIDLGPPPEDNIPVSPAQRGLSRILFPLMILVSIYLLWRGGHAPGGAFQAGALLGAGLVLYVLSGGVLIAGPGGLYLRTLMACGFAFFLTVAVAALVVTGIPLVYPSAGGKNLILLIEALAGASIALTLALAVFGGRLEEDDGAGGGS
jgi:multisubunit Na+/H+ antiporter MnhB subunit